MSCLKSHFAPCCLTGKSGMYFVEDNAADVHDNQVMLVDCRGLFFVMGMTFPNVGQPASTVCVCLCVRTESSRGDGGAFFLLDVRGDQGGAQALVAAQRQRRRDIPYQWPHSVVSF